MIDAMWGVARPSGPPHVSRTPTAPHIAHGHRLDAQKVVQLPRAIVVETDAIRSVSIDLCRRIHYLLGLSVLTCNRQ